MATKRTKPASKARPTKKAAKAPARPVKAAASVKARSGGPGKAVEAAPPGDPEVTEVVAEVIDPSTLGDSDIDEGEIDEAIDEEAIEGASVDGDVFDPASLPARPRVVAYADDPRSKDSALSRYDPMQAYLHEVQRHPLLTPEQEHALAKRYYDHGDLAAAHTLVTSNLRLVVKLAYEYRRAHRNIMDLVQEGNVGLMQAVKKYDPTRGVKLSSYAAWWIRAYILRYILNNWRMVKLGTTQAQRKLFFNLNKEKARLLAMGIDATPKLIAERLNVQEGEVREMDVRLGSSESSLDAPVGEGDGRTLSRVDTMPSLVAGADEQIDQADLTQKLKRKLAIFRETLKGKELEIFDLRLAAGDDPLTLQQLGDRFGVSRERVRQLEARMIGRLREHLRDEMAAASP